MVETDPGEINTLLGHGTEFTGKLTFEGTVRIDGRFQGEVFANDVLIVGEGAEVRAEIDVGTLIVRGGLVEGNIRARDAVEIHAPGRVVGNILSPSLYIGKGVAFDGHCQMREEEAPPMALVEPAPAEAVSAAAESPAPRPSVPVGPYGAPSAPPSAPSATGSMWPPQVVPALPVPRRR